MKHAENSDYMHMYVYYFCNIYFFYWGATPFLIPLPLPPESHKHLNFFMQFFYIFFFTAVWL